MFLFVSFSPSTPRSFQSSVPRTVVWVSNGVGVTFEKECVTSVGNGDVEKFSSLLGSVVASVGKDVEMLHLLLGVVVVAVAVVVVVVVSVDKDDVEIFCLLLELDVISVGGGDVEMFCLMLWVVVVSEKISFWVSFRFCLSGVLRWAKISLAHFFIVPIVLQCAP